MYLKIISNNHYRIDNDYFVKMYWIETREHCQTSIKFFKILSNWATIFLDFERSEKMRISL